MTKVLDRRAFLGTTFGGVVGARAWAESAITRPVVSEKACPLEIIYPVATDGHRGLAVLRKPPGTGPYPAIVWFHGGIVTVPLARLESSARDLASPSRFLAAGYVFVAPTYHSRDVDLQTPDSLEDALALVEYLRNLPFVDRRSVVVCGCSGRGDLALEVAPRTSVCAVVAEEPASLLMSGVFNSKTPKKGDRYTPEDGFFLLENGRRYYTAELQKTFRAKLAKISCPIMIVQGGPAAALRAFEDINAFLPASCPNRAQTDRKLLWLPARQYGRGRSRNNSTRVDPCANRQVSIVSGQKSGDCAEHRTGYG